MAKELVRSVNQVNDQINNSFKASKSIRPAWLEKLEHLVVLTKLLTTAIRSG